MNKNPNQIPQSKYGKLITQDIKLYRTWFNEMVSLHGIQVKVRTPRQDKHYSDRGELISNYNPEVQVGCIFEEYPAQKTLRKLGWFVENEETAPIIHLPYDLDGLEQGTLVSVPSGLEGGEDRLFKVIEMSTLMVFPASVTCKIAPEYKDDVIIAQTHNFTETNFNMLREVHGFDRNKDH